MNSSIEVSEYGLSQINEQNNKSKPLLAAELYLIRVQANHNCWISDTNGDPGRTLIKENAEVHKDRKIANLLCLSLSMNYPNRKFFVEQL